MRIGPWRGTGRGWQLALLACGLAVLAFPQKKKDETQTLQLPRDLPSWVDGDPRRFTFHVTPLSGKGLLSRQVREALNALNHEAGGAPMRKIRAFVAGSGDARRVRDLVSEFFTDRHQPLPVLTLIQAGGLPLEGAQVVLEGTAEGRKEASPYGLVLVSAQPSGSANPLDAVAPLAAKSLAALRLALQAAGSEPDDVARVTCFLSSLENLEATRKLIAAEYRGAAVDYVQTQRAPARAVAACEAVARLRRDTGQTVALLNPEGLPRQAGQSQVALVGAPRVVLTGAQASFGFAEKDARLAFERLQKVLDQAGAPASRVAFVHYYALAAGIADQIRRVRPEFFDGEHPPAGSLLLFEGLPSMDAGFAVDVWAVK